MMKVLHAQTLMPKDWLRRRLSRLVQHTQRYDGAYRPTVTLVDISKWFNVHYDYIRHMEDGRKPINDQWQVQLSQFFYLLDMGIIVLQVKGRHKTWVRAVPGAAVPCKAPMPRVDFSATKLKFD